MQQVRETCPVCFGKRKVTLTLGNDDTVTLPCDYCRCGYEGPTGYVTEYRYVTAVEPRTITGVRIEETSAGEKREYSSGYQGLDIWDIFDTEEEALERCKFKVEEKKREEATRVECLKKQARKSFSWNAGYHIREVKRKEKEIEYHREKAVLCKARSKKEGRDE